MYGNEIKSPKQYFSTRLQSHFVFVALPTVYYKHENSYNAPSLIHILKHIRGPTIYIKFKKENIQRRGPKDI